MRNNREARIIDLPRFSDPRGLLTVAEEPGEVPFPVKRIFWVCGVPPDAVRGGHAHLHQQQIIVAAAGSFSVTADNGLQKSRFLLDSPSRALYVPGGVWVSLEAFSAGAVCLVLASGPYDEDDYIRDHDTFLSTVNE